MKTSTISIRSVDLRRVVIPVLATAAVALLSPPAHAADPEKADAIRVSAPIVKNVGLDTQTAMPITEASITARVRFDPVSLTTNSGAALLRHDVFDAAGKACTAALAEDYGACVRGAVAAAELQVDAAISRARGAAAGG